MWRVSANVRDKVLCNGKAGIARSMCSEGAKTPKPEPPKPAEAKPQAPPPTVESSGSSGGSGIFTKLVGLALVGAGGTCGYALYDPEFRKTVESSVAYSKDALDVILGHPPKQKPLDMTAPIQLSSVEEVKKQSLLKTPLKPSAPESSSAGKPSPLPTPAVKIPDKKVEEKSEEPPKETKAEIDARTKAEAKKAAAEKKKQEQEKIQKALLDKETEEAAQNAAIEAVVKGVLAEANEVYEKAIGAQKKAAETVREHNKQLKKAMEMTEESGDKEGQWQAVNTAFQARQDAIGALEDLQSNARLHMEKVRQAVKDGKENAVTKKNKVLVETQEALNALDNNLTAAQREASKALSEAKIVQEFRDLVKKGRDQFKKELESIKPEVILPKKGGRLTEAEMKEELNLLIAHAHRRIDQLKCQLAEYQSLEQLHIQAALDKQREEDDRLAQELVKAERTRLEAMYAVEKDKWDTNAQVGFEKEIRIQLGRQAAAHSDHLAEVLRVQERELQTQFNVRMEEELVKERDRFQMDVAKWIARLKGIEQAIDGRAELDWIAKKAQELWLACQTLSTSIADGQRGDGEAALKPLANDVMAVRDGGNAHPFVDSIIATLPEDALLRGVWTEEDLRDRFVKVYRMGRRTALIDETGGSLFKFLLSYLQAVFVFRVSKPIRDDDDVDAQNLDSFTLLDSAKLSLENGDLEQTLRFMNQLTGEPRRVASDWIRDARLLLETKQAATALLAHASANGIGSLH